MPSSFLPNLKAPRLGSRLGKYRLVRKLGDGGFAVVYKATDTVEGVAVAVKIPRPELMNRELFSLFQREARLHSGLDHPNILPVKNAEVIEGRLLIVYPLGLCSLADRLRSRRSFNTFMDFAEQMLEAVAHAHSKRIIHCDLKPENFIIFPDNRIRLCDFSISRVSMRTVHGSGSGTVGYVAPEQAMGRPSFRSDVFSLGLIFYQMLTGEVPEWPFEWPPRGYDRLKGKLHPDFIAFLQRAMQMDPKRRFASAGPMLIAYRKLKPRLKRHQLGLRRKRSPAASPDSTKRDWKLLKFRQFSRSYRPSFSLDRHCKSCSGPMSEAMQLCPWCGKTPKPAREKTGFPARCKRCGRGRKLDWRNCAWCFGAGFLEVASQSYSDRRYSARCENTDCRKPQMPFMRYCPWCRKKKRRAWKVTGLRGTCGSCGWTVAKEFWEHCPWCKSRLTRK